MIEKNNGMKWEGSCRKRDKEDGSRKRHIFLNLRIKVGGNQIMQQCKYCKSMRQVAVKSNSL